MINAVLVVVYNTIGKQKLEMYNDLISKAKNSISNYEAEKNDNHGKIVMLEEIREKVLKNSGHSPLVKNDNIEDSLDNENNNYDLNDNNYNHNNNDEVNYENEKLYNQIEENLNKFTEETSNITEFLKNIKEQQEDKFYGFIKDISDVLLHQNALKKKSNEN